MTTTTRPKPRQARRRIPCAQCGHPTGRFTQVDCLYCDAVLHQWCKVHHIVDFAGTGDHPARHFSHLMEAA